MNPANGDATYQALRAAVLSLELLPGERLSERGLEEMLKVSRTPIRAALMRLENDGLTQRVGRGWQIRPIDLTEIRALMEYRAAIETAVMALAVERAQDAELSALRALVKTGHSLDDEDAGLRGGEDFHVALARLSRNPFLADAMSGVLTRLSRTRWLEVRTTKARAQARAEHLGIIAALIARDTQLAQNRAAAHSHGTRERLLEHLAQERRKLRGRGLAIVESGAAA